MRKAITVVAVLCVTAGAVLAGCSSKSADSGGTGTGATGPNETGLRQALTRVAATDDARAYVGYDAVAELTKLVGKQPGGGFGRLLLQATGLGGVALDAPADTGIVPLDADYGILAGDPPHTVRLLAGGQHADRVGTSLTTLGWTRNGDRYVAPDPTQLTDLKMVYGLTFAQVRPEGSDVVVGDRGADLATAGHPAGKTLADDPTTAAIADCLGDVVVAIITTRYRSTTTPLPPDVQERVPRGVQLDKLTEIAVGVRVPKSASDTPRAVVCTAWADQAAADAYAGAVPGALAGGMTLGTDVPYAQYLTREQTTKLGGNAHIVQWTADEANTDQATLVIQLLDDEDVPGLG